MYNKQALFIRSLSYIYEMSSSISLLLSWLRLNIIVLYQCKITRLNKKHISINDKPFYRIQYFNDISRTLFLLFNICEVPECRSICLLEKENQMFENIYKTYSLHCFIDYIKLRRPELVAV